MTTAAWRPPAWWQEDIPSFGILLGRIFMAGWTQEALDLVAQFDSRFGKAHPVILMRLLFDFTRTHTGARLDPRVQDLVLRRLRRRLGTAGYVMAEIELELIAGRNELLVRLPGDQRTYVHRRGRTPHPGEAVVFRPDGRVVKSRPITLVGVEFIPLLGR